MYYNNHVETNMATEEEFIDDRNWVFQLIMLIDAYEDQHREQYSFPS